MHTDFQVKSIDADLFSHLFDLPNEALAQLGAVRETVTQKPGVPCRVSLEDAEIGEEVILLPYEHHQVASPYQSKGPVYIRKAARQAQIEKNTLPKMLEHRLLSLRVYDANGMMVNARTVEGRILHDTVQELFQNNRARYMQVHNAGPGCFNCQIDRVL